MALVHGMCMGVWLCGDVVVWCGGGGGGINADLLIFGDNTNSLK